MTLEKELEFPIELRHPDGGSLLFTDIQTIIDYFFIRGLTHEGRTMFPHVFGLYINGREYNWSAECIKAEEEGMGKLLEETVAHLKYVVDIERSFYDAVNIPHEKDIPGIPVSNRLVRRRKR